MRLPDVIGIGPPRTGSTWLYNALRDAVDMPDGVKEPQFFSTFYDKGIDWYAHHFRYATGRRPIAEISPPYFFHPETPARIKTHIPNCKTVATMRNPVDRIYSVYKLMRHYGWVRRGTLDEVLQSRPNLGGGNRYAAHLQTWFDTFGRENVLVTMYDELRDQPQEYLNRVCDFINIPRIALAPRAEFCGGRGEPYPRLTIEQEERLRERYLPEVEALEKLLGIDLSAWKKPRATQPERRTPRLAVG